MSPNDQFFNCHPSSWKFALCRATGEEKENLSREDLDLLDPLARGNLERKKKGVQDPRIGAESWKGADCRGLMARPLVNGNRVGRPRRQDQRRAPACYRTSLSKRIVKSDKLMPVYAPYPWIQRFPVSSSRDSKEIFTPWTVARKNRKDSKRGNDHLFCIIFWQLISGDNWYPKCWRFNDKGFTWT